jgi:AraC-like DNA-binding protein
MQKRPKQAYRLEYAPISLPDDFPITGGGDELYHLPDRPITRLHQHNCLELGYCHSGSGIFVIEDKVFHFQTGDVSVINELEMHLAQSTKGTFSQWTFISLDPLRLLGGRVDNPQILNTLPLAGPSFPNILPGQQHPDIAQIMRELIKELAGKKSGYQSCVRGLVWALLVRLHRLPGRDERGTIKTGSRDIERLAPALNYMAAHYMEPLRMAILARQCFMSLSNFRRMFKRTVKKTPLEYLTHLRILMATALLTHKDKTIMEVSLETGYPTLSSFNRQFKAATGKSPRAWRQLQAKQRNNTKQNTQQRKP